MLYLPQEITSAATLAAIAKEISQRPISTENLLIPKILAIDPSQ